MSHRITALSVVVTLALALFSADAAQVARKDIDTVEVAGNNLLDIKKLGYVYNDPPKRQDDKKAVPVPKKERRRLAEIEFIPPVYLQKDPFPITLPIPPQEREKLAKLLKSEIRFPAPASTFTLILKGVNCSERLCDSEIAFFINAPPDAKLDRDGPYYAGGTSFFGPVKDQNVFAHRMDRAMETLRKKKQLRPDRLEVTVQRIFLGRPPAEMTGTLTFRKIVLYVQE